MAGICGAAPWTFCVAYVASLLNGFAQIVDDGELAFRLLIVGEVLWAGGVEIAACVPVPDAGLVVAAPEIEVREEDAVDVGRHFEISAGRCFCRRNGPRSKRLI